MKTAIELVAELCDSIVAEDLRSARPAGWHWGEGLFGFGLCELNRAMGYTHYLPWLRRYLDHYVAHPPTIDQSDMATPGLASLDTWSWLNDQGYRDLTERVAEYVRHEPRDVGGAVNHLGHARIAKLYPRSVWVDSLMMFSVFPARYGAELGDQQMLDVAAAQPGVYANLLFDEGTGLWAHSWWQRTQRPYPNGHFWARGNAWVVAALPMILAEIGRHPQSAAIIRLLRRTSAALLAEQRSDGTWDTLLGQRRRSYRELSATALIASGWLQACRHGWLERRYIEPARLALHAVVSSLQLIDGQWRMPEASGPTIPLPGAPGLGYRLVRRGSNRRHAVAALTLAAVNDWRLG